MSFPYMNPIPFQATIALGASGEGNTEVVLFRTPQVGTIQNMWAVVDNTAAGTSNLTVTFFNRGTAYTSTSSLGVAGGAATTWGATTPKAVTLANNTAIAADSYISAYLSRIAASTASMWSVTLGGEFLAGNPATAN